MWKYGKNSITQSPHVLRLIIKAYWKGMNEKSRQEEYSILLSLEEYPNIP